MPGQVAKRKRHDLDGADQVSLPSLLFPAPLFLPSIFSIALTCNGHTNHTLRQSPKIYIKFTVALAQIKAKGYHEKYLRLGKKVTLIGAAFDGELRNLSDRQIEVVC